MINQTSINLIARDKAPLFFFHQNVSIIVSYFSMKTYVVVTH